MTESQAIRELLVGCVVSHPPIDRGRLGTKDADELLHSFDGGGLERWVWERRRNGGKSPRQGARTVVFLACSPSLRGFDAVYWKDCAPLPPSRYAMDPANTTRLWTMSERLCGITWG